MSVRRSISARPRMAVVLAVAVLAPLFASTAAVPVQAASSAGCVGGGYRLTNLATGRVVANVANGEVDTAIAASEFGSDIGVRGRYNEWNIHLSDFALYNYFFTGAANELDITGGVRTPVWPSKIPDHRGISLTSGISV